MQTERHITIGIPVDEWDERKSLFNLGTVLFDFKLGDEELSGFKIVDIYDARIDKTFVKAIKLVETHDA